MGWAKARRGAAGSRTEIFFCCRSSRAEHKSGSCPFPISSFPPYTSHFPRGIRPRREKLYFDTQSHQFYLVILFPVEWLLSLNVIINKKLQSATGESSGKYEVENIYTFRTAEKFVRPLFFNKG
jgi:hypothetical protein